MSQKPERAPAQAQKSAKPAGLIIAVIALLAVTIVVAVVIQQKNAQMTKEVRSQLFPDGMESTKVNGPMSFDANAGASATNTADNAAASATNTTTKAADDAPPVPTHQVTIETARGTIVAELYGHDAPITVDNFVKLASKGFYDGLTFHRVEPGFVIQGGDPQGNGLGGTGHTIKLEISPKLKHVEGALAMARSGDPDSADCQFYITLADQRKTLDGNYAVFGKVIKGMDVVKRIVKDDKMLKVTVKELK